MSRHYQIETNRGEEMMCCNLLVCDVLLFLTKRPLCNKATLVFLLSCDCGCFHCFENGRTCSASSNRFGANTLGSVVNSQSVGWVLQIYHKT